MKAMVRFLGRWALATAVVVGILAVGAGLAILGDVLNCRLLIGVCLILAMTGSIAWVTR